VRRGSLRRLGGQQSACGQEYANQCVPHKKDSEEDGAVGMPR
jgi:hypothetical protein